jgi:hypothetical protein
VRGLSGQSIFMGHGPHGPFEAHSSHQDMGRTILWNSIPTCFLENATGSSQLSPSQSRAHWAQAGVPKTWAENSELSLLPGPVSSSLCSLGNH